jgi:site-specific recombinase XerD
MDTRITLSNAIDGYLIAARARRLSPHTLSDYQTTYRALERHIGGRTPLAAITARDLQQFLAGLDHLAAKTLLNYHTGLSALWTWALDEDLVDRHIVHDIPRPKPEKPAIVPLTKSDLQLLLAGTARSQEYRRGAQRPTDHRRPTEHRDRAILLLLVDTGLRASELVSLCIYQADLRNQRITVDGKGKKERSLPISARTSRALWKYLQTRDDADRKAAPLFATRTGAHLDRNTLRQMLQRIGDRQGVPGVTLHRFRHTFAINFLRNGGNIYALQRMLGHETLDMVQRYLALVQGDVDNAHLHASPVEQWRL